MEPALSAWHSAKDETVEGRIVALADYLAVVSYLSQEARGANNTVVVHYKEIVEYGESFDDETFDFLRPIINSAKGIVDTIFKKAMA